MTKPYVVAGCPLKKRAWVARRHVESLVTQTRRPNSLLYLLNDDGDDGTDEALQSCVPLVLSTNTPDSYLERFVVKTYNTGDEGVDRVPVDGRPRYSIENLARVRNKFIETFLEDEGWKKATHLWSCDSDVLPDREVLSLLLEHDVPIVGAVVRNSTAPVYNFWCSRDSIGRPARGRIEPGVGAMGEEIKFNPLLHTHPYPPPDMFDAPPITLVGACVLIRRDVLESGVRYSHYSNGEDVGFCVSAHENGYSMYVQQFARTTHVQRDGSEWR